MRPLWAQEQEEEREQRPSALDINLRTGAQGFFAAGQVPTAPFWALHCGHNHSLDLPIGFHSCETVCLFRRTGPLWLSQLAIQASEIWQRLYDAPELGT